MSVNFGNVNISNGAARQLLEVIGYVPTDPQASNGSMPIDTMLAGIQTAKANVGEDLVFLDYLEMVEEEVLTAKTNGMTIFEWF